MSEHFRPKNDGGLSDRLREMRLKREKERGEELARKAWDQHPPKAVRREEIHRDMARNREAWLAAAETERGIEIQALGKSFAARAISAQIRTRNIKVAINQRVIDPIGRRSLAIRAVEVKLPGWRVQKHESEITKSRRDADGDYWDHTERQEKPGVNVLTDGRIAVDIHNQGGWLDSLILFDSPLPFYPKYLGNLFVYEPTHRSYRCGGTAENVQQNYRYDYERILASFLFDNGIDS